MDVYEIINPSDACSVRASDDKIAAAACLLLGRGAYGLRKVGNDELIVPVMLLATSEQTDAWLAEYFGTPDLSRWVKERSAEVSTCLDTFLYCVDERASIEAALEAVSDVAERAKARAAFQDENRSSMNNIGHRAEKMSERLKEMMSAERQEGQ